VNELKIDALREQYKNKWLAIKVSKFSKDKVPLEGSVIAEADNREELWKKVPQNKRKAIYIMYSGKYLKEGYAAAF